MTLESLVRHLRTSILDDTGGTGVCWDDIRNDDDDVYQLKWSNEELSRFITEAERQACRTAFLLKDFGGDYDLAVTAGIATYDLPTKTLKILGARLASERYQLDPCEMENIWLEPNWETAEGTPKHFIPDYTTRTIRLFKAPIVDDTLKLMVYRLPAVDLAWDNRDGSPEIAEHYHLGLLNYAAYLAYNKDDANTFDPTRSNYYRALWEQDYPMHLSVYAEKRQARNGKRTIRYGGIGGLGMRNSARRNGRYGSDY